MADKKKRLNFTTPRGTFRYPKVTEPDFGNDRFPKPNGEWSVQVVVRESDPATQQFLDKLRPLHEAAVERAEEEFKKLKVEQRKKLGGVKVNDLFTQVYDQETEEPTGEIIFKLALPYKIELKKGAKAGQTITTKVPVFDAKGTPMKKVPQIGGGTVGKVSFSVDPEGYFIPGTGAAGLKLSLEAVQVIELKQYGQRDASGYGFGAEEGYEYEDEGSASGFGDETGSDDTDDTTEDEKDF